MRLSREKTHGVVADAVIYFLYDGMKMFFSLLTHSQQLLDYTLRNGTLAIFPLTPAFTVTGLGNQVAHSSIVMAKIWRSAWSS